MNNIDRKLIQFAALVCALGGTTVLAMIAGVILLVQAPVWGLALAFVVFAASAVWLFHSLVVKSAVATKNAAVDVVETKKKKVVDSRESEELWKQKIERRFGLDVVSFRWTDTGVLVASRKSDDPRGRDLYQRLTSDGKALGSLYRMKDELGFTIHDAWWNPEYHHESFDIFELHEDGNNVALTRRDGSPVLRPYSSLIED